MSAPFPATQSFRTDPHLAAHRARFWQGVETLSLTEAAQRLGTTPDALRLRIARGTCPVPVERESVVYRFRAEDIDAWATAREEIAA